MSTSSKQNLTNSGTSTVSVYAYDMSPHRTVYLIDTPGFDDTTMSDAEVLKEIATWLGDSYNHRILLHGIIYLHRITDRRMQGSARRNIILFRQLCGQDALRKVVLVTTMWDQTSEAEGEKREAELIQTEDFWGWMVDNGSSYYRHNHTHETAADIVHQLATHNQPIKTTIQRELIDEQRGLNDTSAGRELHTTLTREKEKLVGNFDDMSEQLRIAIQDKDKELESILRHERDRSSDLIRKVELEINNLRVSMESLIRQRDHRVAIVQEQLRDDIEQIRQQLEVGEEPTQEGMSDTITKPLAAILTPPASIRSGSVQITPPVVQPEENSQPPTPFQARRLPQESTTASVSMWGDIVCIIGDFCVNSSVYPKLKLDSAYLRTVSLGDAADGARSWIARYEKTWSRYHVACQKAVNI